MAVTEPVFSLRPIVLADAALLAQLHSVSFEGQDVWDAKAMSEILTMPGAFGFVGLLAGAPCGFLIARMAGEESEIISLGVSPERRRRGLARAMLRALAAEVVALGGTRTFLEVAESNKVARALYKAEGFREVGRRPAYYRDEKGGETAMVMAHSIGRGNS